MSIPVNLFIPQAFRPAFEYLSDARYVAIYW